MHTAEAVFQGHPDKICDLIADAFLDEYLSHDPFSRVALEVQGGHHVSTITGEITSSYILPVQKRRPIIEKVFRDIRYPYTFKFFWNVAAQSSEIASGVDLGGAGDSGITIGYATNKTPEMIPPELAYARRIVNVFREKYDGRFGPDGKVQVSVDDEGKPVKVIVSVQHKTMEVQEARERSLPIILLALGPGMHPEIIVNPGGSFKEGGFDTDTGSTGRKIVQDQYGPRIPVGGGAFSGKDATKVDRSGSYYARHLAVQYIKEGYKEAFVEFAWAIGEPKPIFAIARLFSEDSVTTCMIHCPSVSEIIDQWDLRKPIFYERTKKGHYGFDNL